MKKLVPLLLAFVLVGVAGAAPSVVSTNETSATVAGLDCGSKYRFAIRKYKADGSLNTTTTYVYPQTKSCPDTQPPSAPPGVAATGATQTSVSVSWSASTDSVGVTGYDLYRGGAKVDWTSATSYTFGGLSCGTSYQFAVEARDAAGNRSAPSVITASTTACPPPSCPTGEYVTQHYGNMTLSGTPVLQRCEPAINYDWGGGSPDFNVPSNQFSTRWTGTFSSAAGSHHFTATADDGIRVWVDGAVLIDSWKDQAPTTYQATRTLTAGDHQVKVEYYENGGGAVAKVSWQLSQVPPPPPPPPPGGEPGPVAGQGYSRSFSDDFTELNRAVWTEHAYWDTSVANSVFAQDGVLNIVSRRSQGYPHIHVQTGPEWFQEPTRFDQKFGYFEARMRFTGGKGSWPAFWLSSLAHAQHPNWPSCPEPDLNFELDIMEFQGDEPNTFYGTQHRNTGGVCGVPDQSRPCCTNLGFPLAGDWHVYSILWTASEIRWYADGQHVLTSPLYDSGDQQMYILLSMQACGWDPTNGCDASTADELRTEVDWVRVWQK